MTTYINAILVGIGNFPFFAVVITVPMIVAMLLKYKAVNFVRFGLGYAMLLYGVCLTAVVFLPLPTPEQAALLHEYRIQMIPFHFVADIIRESPFVLTNPATYLPSIYNTAVLQVVLNIIMMVPLGVFLRYYFGMNKKKVIIIAALVSLFIEATQLTGIYGVYHGSYRLCDIDDLMANTLGGYLGYRLVITAEHIIPRISTFDISIVHKGHASHQA